MFLLLALLFLIMYNIKVAKMFLFIFKKQLKVDQSFFNLLLNVIWFYHRFDHSFVSFIEAPLHIVDKAFI